MSALADRSWEMERRAVKAATPHADRPKSVEMGEWFRGVRDTLLVLMIQIIFRTVLMLRRWNY
jgi:hypothetical protein